MNELPKVPGEIAVIRLSNNTLSVVKIDDYDTEKYYWFGGFSWAYGGYHVIEYVTETNWEKIEIWFIKKYEPALPSNEIKQSAFWLSTGGELFYCKEFAHDGLARRITACLFNSLEGTRLLEEKNWLRCYKSGLFVPSQYETPTPNTKQAETISKLFLIGDNEWKRHMHFAIEKYQVL